MTLITDDYRASGHSKGCLESTALACSDVRLGHIYMNTYSWIEMIETVSYKLSYCIHPHTTTRISFPLRGECTYVVWLALALERKDVKVIPLIRLVNDGKCNTNSATHVTPHGLSPTDAGEVFGWYFSAGLLQATIIFV